jgi:hypothetical protein
MWLFPPLAAHLARVISLGKVDMGVIVEFEVWDIQRYCRLGGEFG